MHNLDPQAEKINKPHSGTSSLAAMFRKNIWGWVTLIVVTVVCVVIVQVFKKPGQMSVIESQAMDMTAMVPPEGAVPVALAAA